MTEKGWAPSEEELVEFARRIYNESKERGRDPDRNAHAAMFVGARSALRLIAAPEIERLNKALDVAVDIAVDSSAEFARLNQIIERLRRVAIHANRVVWVKPDGSFRFSNDVEDKAELARAIAFLQPGDLEPVDLGETR